MYLAIDYGKKRIGLALGQVIPKGAGIIDGTLPQEVILNQIKSVCENNDVLGIVIGLPVRSQGEGGTLAGEIMQFGESVSEICRLPVYFEEEQFTSAEAERRLGNKRDVRESGLLDEMAAVLILEQFLEDRN